jgi:transcriptional regulator with XRE-family HTH domain
MANLLLYHFSPYRIFVTMELTKEEVCKHVGTKIREARENKGLTMEKFAHESGIDYTQISRIELGKINTSIYHIYLITKKLDLQLLDIFQFD